MAGKARANGEGSIFPYRNGFAAYVRVTKPDGKRQRKYVYGKTREEVHDKWLKLHQQAKAGPVATKVPTLNDYLSHWLTEVVAPNLAPSTATNYDMFVRLYIAPALGKRRIDKLTVSDVQTWLNKLRDTCQCCAQGTDESRDRASRRCCAVGNCCDRVLSDRTSRDAWTTLRNALNSAIREEFISRNVAALARAPKSRTRKPKPWTADEARQFLESARVDRDPFYAAYVLILALGLRRGEALGLRWEDVDLDNHQLAISYQLQRVAGRLLHRETKTEASDATMPLPDLCLTALLARKATQDADRASVGADWQGSELVFTTKLGTPIEPRNFHRSFKARATKAGVRQLSVHSTRRTCASLLVALDVHPRVAMQILRHTQIAVTMNVYSEAPSKATSDALKLLSQRLDT